MNIKQANELLARWKGVTAFARKYGLTYKQTDDIIWIQKELSKYKTTYKAK